MSNSQTAAPLKKERSVVRIAAGEQRTVIRRKAGEDQTSKPQTPIAVAPKPEATPAEAAPAKPALPPPPKTIRRAGGGKVEINPKLESSRGVLPPPQSTNAKPMSVAEKKRAEAELAFSRVAPMPARPQAQARPHTVAQNGAAQGPRETNGPSTHKSQFELRISERDSLTTTLRLAESRDAALAAAHELAQRFKLPPDQTLLVKVILLGEPELTKLALEELLELDDRGRVRRTPDLKDALDHLKSNDHETNELKDLLLEKIGARSTT